MLSILIPIHNYYIVTLVEELKSQCQKLDLHYEIICFDDFSQDKYKMKNRVVSGWMGVSYIELWENMGRSKIRNMLASNARYEYLLFLDCDSKVSSKKFIRRYVDRINPQTILCGGRKVGKKPPTDMDKKLHWFYSFKREMKALHARNRNPVQYFHSNNFVIPRKLMLENPFEESIKQYGYEDLIFAHQISRKNYIIKHIDNPVIHKGLVNFKIFLENHKSSIEVLSRYIHTENFPKTKLTSSYFVLRKLGLERIFVSWLTSQKDKFIQQLRSNNPRLLLLDLLKLYWLMKTG